MEGEQRVRVFMRVKPTAYFAHENIEIHSDEQSVTVHTKKDERRGYINNQVLDWRFCYDGILHHASQEETFKKCSADLVIKALDGYNCTIFAYGETGAGKTYTMSGTNDFKDRGIMPRALTLLYKEIKERADHDINVRLSYMQIYNDKIYDLLETVNGSPTYEQLTVTENIHGLAYVKGLACLAANSEEEALSLLFEGESNRVIGHHKLNRYSSRSHCIFSIFIESHSRTLSNAGYVMSRLNFVDLAGSERVGKTKCEGRTQVEALYINKSLTFLEQAVIALADLSREHIPFRQSKLTHVLKDSLGLGCQTVMIGNVWGEFSQLEETLSTLRFGNRVMRIPNQPAKNIIYDPIRVCRALEKEIVDLRKELSIYDTLTNRKQISYEPLSEGQIQEIRGHVRKFIDGETSEIEIVNMRQVNQVFEHFKTLVRQAEKENDELRVKIAALNEDTNSIGEKSVPGSSQQNAKPSQSNELQLVGETDGQNFGVGIAPSSARAPNVHSTVASKRTKSRKGKTDSVLADVKRSPSPAENVKQLQDQTDKPPSTNPAAAGNRAMASPTRPRTPPPKQEAFGQFRHEKGKQLNDVLVENKEILNCKKSEAKDTLTELNKIKKEMDECKRKLEEAQAKREREEQNEGEENPVIEEEEFFLLKKIGDLKLKYRMDFEALENLRSDVAYCENLVNQCRKRLVTEFEAWYADCFVSVAEDSIKSEESKSDDVKNSQKAIKTVEDEEEKFDRLKIELLMENPESVPFYNAKSQTERRKLYSGSQTGKRKPGEVLSSVRNKPPNTLTVK